MTHRPRILWLLAMAATLGACPSDDAPKVIEVPDGLSTDNSPALPASLCDGLDDGVACATDRYCVAGKCQFNRCGDGVRADDEACDDGNLARGDGCSPACGFEYGQCDGGAWVKLSDGCGDPSLLNDGGVPEMDGACPKPLAIVYSKNLPKYLIDPNTKDLDKSLTSPPYLFAGDSVVMRAKSQGDTSQVIWMSRSDQAQDSAWTTDHLTNSLTPAATFTCDADTVGRTFAVTFLWFQEGLGHCPQYPGDLIACLPRDFIFPKFSENTIVDGGVGDAATDDAGVPDAALSDAGVHSDAQVADGGAISRFRRPACESCIKAACADYSGVDLVGPCLQGTNFDAAFARACSDAYFCSHNANDGCGYDKQRGAVACLCGTSVTVDQCQASAANVQGACKNEWYTATHCPVTNQTCALDAFQDLTLPASYAAFLLECQSVACEAECAR